MGGWGCGLAASARPDIPTQTDPTYHRVLERYSRTQSKYQGIQRRLIWAATLESCPFRLARAEAYARLLRLTEEELRAIQREEARESQQFLDFFVGFFTETLSWNDLDAEHSMWRVDLQIDGERTLLPVAIERGVETGPNVRALYPYLGHFSRGYRVRFRLGDLPEGGALLRRDGWLTLRVSSAIAHGELTWPTAALEGAEPTGTTQPPQACSQDLW
jgi:hypothetical protein